MKNENKIWKSAIYLRLSKDDGQIESSSISNQRDLINNFAKQKDNISIYNERIDDGISGVSFDRPSFNAMMDDVRDGVIDCIIVKDLSRFGRDHLEAGEYIQNIFPALGVRFISINDNIDTLNKKSSEDSLIIPMKNIINQLYADDTSKKIRSQFEISRKKGKVIGAFCTYGYIKATDCKNKIVVDENVADYVREIYRLKIAGMSADKIATRFNAMGILSPLEYKKYRGENFKTSFQVNVKASWSAQSILRILKNPVYIGTLVQGKETRINYKIKKKTLKPKEEWDIVKNNHEPIVDLITYEDVQRAMSLDTRTAPSEEYVYLFSGILRCGECGEIIKRQISKSAKKSYIYYYCNKCNCTGITESILTEAVYLNVKNLIAEMVTMKAFFNSLDTSNLQKIKVKNLNLQIEQKAISLNRVKNFKKQLYEDYKSGVILPKDYNSYYADYCNDEKEFELQIKIIKNEIADILSNKDENTLWITRFKRQENISELNRSIVIGLVENILIHDNSTIEILYRFHNELNDVMLLLQSSKAKEVVKNG